MTFLIKHRSYILYRLNDADRMNLDGAGNRFIRNSIVAVPMDEQKKRDKRHWLRFASVEEAEKCIDAMASTSIQERMALAAEDARTRDIEKRRELERVSLQKCRDQREDR